MRRKWWIKVRLRRWWRELLSWSFTTAKLLLLALALFGAWTVLTTASVPMLEFNESSSPAETTGYEPPEPPTETETVTTTATKSKQDVDSDGDNLPNSLEADLQSASEWQKDVYIVVVYGSNTEPLTASQIQELEQRWADMPVENPNGNTGIRLHVLEQQSVDKEITWSTSNFDDLRDEYYTRGRLGQWHCRAHVVLIADTDSSRWWGYANSGGHFLAIDGTEDYTYQNGVTFETLGVTHELLHNVVGEFPSSWKNVTSDAHTNQGYLSHGESYDEISYLSQPSAKMLTEEGFAELPENAINAC